MYRRGGRRVALVGTYGNFGLVLSSGLGEEDVEGHGALVDGRDVGVLCEESSKVLAL